MKLSIDISAPCALWRGLPRARALARETVAACLLESGFDPPPGSELSLCLTDDTEVQKMNARWRGNDEATNVLSFPAASTGPTAAAPILGDIALAYETLSREAQEMGVLLADHYRHVVAHGFLHLIGHDHQTDEEAERMEDLERRILARLGVADPYADRTVER
jgi:probable rRNA maturation factor